MKILKKPKPWSAKVTCTGVGHGGGGCGAKLQLEVKDLYLSGPFADGGSRGDVVTFKCVECGIETDFRRSVPTPIREKLPKRPPKPPAKKVKAKANGAAKSKKAEGFTHTLLFQEWEESERSWGTRPDGWSLHLTRNHRDAYVKKHNEDQHKFFVSQGMSNDAVPDEYTRVCGEPVLVNVTKSIYDRVKKNGGDYRGYDRQTRPGPSHNLQLGPKGLDA